MGDNKRDSLARGMKTQKIRKSGTDLVGTRDAGCGSGAPEEEGEGEANKVWPLVRFHRLHRLLFLLRNRMYSIT